MNEKLSYATMLDIPVSTSMVTYKKPKKKWFKKKIKDTENVKEELIHKINSENVDNEEPNAELPENMPSENEYSDMLVENTESATENNDNPEYEVEKTVNIHPEKKGKRKFKFSVIGVQVAVICLLIASIFITNTIYPDSGINVFFNSIFDRETSVTDTRVYKDFKPVISDDFNDKIVVDKGIMTFNGVGSIYSPCDGKVTQFTKGEDGTFTMEITHSENFKTILKGIEKAYCGLNDKVYNNIPVGYIKDKGFTMCFTNGEGTLISDYEISDNMVVWAV